MAKQVKLQKNGQTVYPQTVGDAVAVAGQTLTAYLQSLQKQILLCTMAPMLLTRIERLEALHTTTTPDPSATTTTTTSTTTTTTTTEEAAGAKGAIGAAFSDDEDEDTSSLERTVSDYENGNI